MLRPSLGTRPRTIIRNIWEGEGQRNPYCLATIPPKIMKLRKSFQKYVKEGA